TAAQTAFESIWPEHKWQAFGIEVGSGVSDQPMSDVESITGATTRAWRSLQASDAEYGVGLEGGVHPVLNSRFYWQHLLQLDEKVFGRQDPSCQEEIFFDCGWAVVMDRQGTVGTASSIRMQVPSVMMKHIH